MQSDSESAVATCRDCCIDWSSLSTEYQWLCEGYGNLVRSTLQRRQCAICAINGKRTCNLANLRLDNDACERLAVTLYSQAKNAGEVVELNSIVACLSNVAVQRSCARSESTHGVRLLSQEVYRVSCTLASTLSCRINHAIRCGQLLLELEFGSCSTVVICGQSGRRLTIDCNLVALAPVERILAICIFLAELGTRTLQRYRKGGLTLTANVDAKVLSRVCHARKCEQTRHRHHEKFCKFFHHK